MGKARVKVPKITSHLHLKSSVNGLIFFGGRSMKIRLLGFMLLLAINTYITYSLWDTILISTLPVCLIALAMFCSGLFLIIVNSKLQRTITYFLAVVILLIGLFFAIYYRRLLVFLRHFR